MQTQENPLLHLQSRANDAHRNTSFSPERRGEQMIKDYGEELAADLAELRKGENVSEEAVNDYKSRYERFFSSYLHAKSNTFSVMITGGGNFPVRRHEKANRSERKHYEVFREWRERAKKSIMRKAQPAKTFVSELDRYKKELADRQTFQSNAKEINKIIKSKRIAEADKLNAVKTLGYTESEAAKFFTPDFGGRIGVRSFELTNNNASIKRVEGMIKQLEQKEELRQEEPEREFTFDGGTVTVDYEADRIKIFFANRPTFNELQEWKSKGLSAFNWSPSAKAWQRKITGNALYCVKHMLPNIKKIG